MYMVMRPEEKYGRKNRLIMFPKKCLPDLESHERHPALINMVSSDLKGIERDLEGTHYDTKTKGERTLPAARPFGEAIYSTITHHGRGHLIFVLELPKEGPHHVQKLFNLTEEGSFVVNVSNPDIPPTHHVPFEHEKKVEYPEEVSAVFRGRRWASVNHPELLDYENAHLLFVGARSNIVDEVGEEAEELKEKRDQEVKHFVNVREMFKELKLPHRKFKEEALTQDELV